MTSTRREFTVRVGGGLAALVLGRRVLGQGTAVQSLTGPMSADEYRPVSIPAKPGAAPSMDAAARDALEHRLKCVCGCPLDVYTCRTTDFNCSVSPAMHRDVVALADGGHTSTEILQAFEDVYGERVFTAPKAEGFNRLAYITPFAAIGAGAVVAAFVIRSWMRAPEEALDAPRSPAAAAATPDELARVRDAVRADDR